MRNFRRPVTGRVVASMHDSAHLKQSKSFLVLFFKKELLPLRLSI
jgi:hypothetical protein